TTFTYTLSLHDALPISSLRRSNQRCTSDRIFARTYSNSASWLDELGYVLKYSARMKVLVFGLGYSALHISYALQRAGCEVTATRSEEHTSELQSRENLV